MSAKPEELDVEHGDAAAAASQLGPGSRGSERVALPARSQELDVELGDAAGASPEPTPCSGGSRSCSEESKGSDDGTCGRRRGPVAGGPIGLLRRNPELAKVIVTVGFQMAAADIAGTIDLGPDTNQTWGSNTAAIVALFEMAANVMAYLAGPIFGRFTDLVDRRIVLVVYGFITFIPTFVYWFFPLTAKVVWATHVASIFAAIGRTSNVAFALSVDFTAFEDRALAAGVYYAATSLITVLLSVLPAYLTLFYLTGVRDFLNVYPRAVLWYQSGLVALFAVSAACLAKPVKRGAEDDCQDKPLAPTNSESNASFKCLRVWVDMLKLVLSDERLCRLILAAFLFSLSGTLSRGIDGQFFADALGLYKKKNDSLNFDQMNVLRSLGAHAVMPAYLLAGYVAMKAGTLKLLRKLAPLTALFALVGVLMLVIDHMWYVPVVVVAQAMVDLYEAPLMRLAAGVARPGRVGTWLTLVGMGIEAGNMLGNFSIFLATTLLSESGRSFIWVYYPVAGAVALCTLFVLLGRPKTAIGWGAAAGNSKEQFEAIMAARKFARRWKRRTFNKCQVMQAVTGIERAKSSKASVSSMEREGSTEDIGVQQDASFSEEEPERVASESEPGEAPDVARTAFKSSGSTESVLFL